MPTLTVTLCNYNHGKWVGRAIESVLTQSRQPDQFIIVDDGSTDNSAEVINAYAARHRCIRFERLSCNTRLWGAFKRALELADCDYLCCVSADDYILPGFFEKTMAMVERFPDAGVAFGKVQVLDADHTSIGVMGIEQWQNVQYVSPERFRKDWIDVHGLEFSLAPSTIYKMSVVRELGGFRQELGAWCDTFLIRSAALKYGVCYLPEVCAAYAVGHETMSGRMRRRIAVVFDICEQARRLVRAPEYNSVYTEEDIRIMDAKCQEWWMEKLNGHANVLHNSLSTGVTQFRQCTIGLPWHVAIIVAILARTAEIVHRLMTGLLRHLTLFTGRRMK